MKSRLASTFAALFAVVALGGVSSAQDRTLASAAGDRFVISAKAGGVNYTEGSVAVARQMGGSGRLIKGDNLEVGDRVSTDIDGKAEILLNPGSYLRLGGNSAFEFKATSLDDLVLVLGRGSAILEVFADEEFKVTVETPSVTYSLIDTGVYRIDLIPGGSPRLEVWKGKAQVGSSSEVVKGGKTATGTDLNLAVAKFDRDEKDPFEIWSKSRSKELSKALASVQRNTMRTALMQSFLGRRWDVFNSFGLWVNSPFGYCFLPFGYGWSSPYGYGFGRYLGWYNLPYVVYYAPQTGTGAGGGQPTGNQSIGRSRTTVKPPFEKMGGDRSGGRSIDFGDASAPSVRTAPPPVIIPTVAPSSSRGSRSSKP